MFRRNQEQHTFAQMSWLKIETRAHDVFVRFSGRLDHTVRHDLNKALERILKSGINGAVVLQLADVHFLDAVAGATLARFLRQATQRGVSVEIWNVSPEVQRVFAGLGISLSSDGR